jgi:hypothetical protein
MRQITDRMRKIICASLNGDVNDAVAFRQIRMLERLRLCVASSDYEDRLAALEAHAGVPNDRVVRRRSTGPRHYGPRYAVEEGDDLFEEGSGEVLQ